MTLIVLDENFGDMNLEKSDSSPREESSKGTNKRKGDHLEKDTDKSRRVQVKIWVSVKEVTSSVTLDSYDYPDPTVDDV